MLTYQVSFQGQIMVIKVFSETVKNIVRIGKNAD